MICADEKITSFVLNIQTWREKDSEKKKKISHSPGSSCEKCGSRKCSSASYKIDQHYNGTELVTVLRPVNNNFTRVLDVNTYWLDEQVQKYDVRISGMTDI